MNGRRIRYPLLSRLGSQEILLHGHPRECKNNCYYSLRVCSVPNSMRVLIAGNRIMRTMCQTLLDTVPMGRHRRCRPPFCDITYKPSCNRAGYIHTHTHRHIRAHTQENQCIERSNNLLTVTRKPWFETREPGFEV